MKIPLAIPVLSGNEEKYLKECIDTNFVSSVGAFVTEFENKLADFLGVKYVVAVMNGTAAIHLSLVSLGIGEGDDVLVPNLTFVAPLNAVAYTGASPVLIDSEWKTFGICPDSIIKTIETEYDRDEKGLLINKSNGNILKAILPVHIFGNTCAIEKICEIAKEYNLKVIEDASEALGAKAGSSMAGTIGDIGCFSFNGNKIITTGGGGAIVTNDEKISTYCKHLSTTAKTDAINFIHDEVGYNYRMVNLLAAVGVAQLEQLEGFLESKERIFQSYKKIFENEDYESDFKLFYPVEGRSNFWFNTLLIDKKAKQRAVEYFISNGVQVRPAWELMERLPAFKDCKKSDTKVSREIHDQAISIPCSTNLSEDEVSYVGKIAEGFKL